MNEKTGDTPISPARILNKIQGNYLSNSQMYEKKVQMQRPVFRSGKMLPYYEVSHVIHVAYCSSSESCGKITGAIVKYKCNACFFGGCFEDYRIQE